MILLAIVKLNNKIVELRGKKPTWEVTFFDSFLNEKDTIKFTEVFWATLIAIAISILVVWIINIRGLYRMANFFKISNKHGEEDIWEAFIDRPEIEWVTIRDIEDSVVYQGAIKLFSQKDNTRELMLIDVIVYKQEENELIELYALEEMYINFDPNSKIMIEVQKKEDEENEQEE